MQWEMIATLIGVIAAIVGGVWVIENRFERRLDKEINRLDEKIEGLDDKIEGLRSLFIEHIAKK